MEGIKRNWKVCKDPLSIVDESGDIFIARFDFDDADIIKAIDRANAQRIVTCVNVCEGVSSKYLESSNTLANAIKRQLDQSEKVKGELLEMLKYAKKMLHPSQRYNDINYVIVTITKAINRIEKGNITEEKKTLSCTCKDGQFGEGKSGR